jgi:protein phosphatase
MPRKCPRCSYVNLPGALFCFRCNRNLEDPAAAEGTDGIGELIDGALKFIQRRGYRGLGPDRIERLREARSKLLPENLNGEPLTCLRCGVFNLIDAPVCTQCGGGLIIPDHDLQIIARPSARTSVGKVRQNNEDNLGLWAIDGVVLALVADGMGGAAAGEEASRLTVEAVQADFLGTAHESDQLQFIAEDELAERMRAAILDANMTLFQRARQDSSRKGMGTTSTLVMVRSNRALIAHVGDSRAYLIDRSDRRITQLTNDHSFVQALVSSGHLTPEQARYHPMGHVLFRALGQTPELEVDLYTRAVRAGDALVICSDGLTRHLTPEDLLLVVLENAHPAEASLELIEMTNARGAEDNVSVVVIYLDHE